MLVQLEPAFVLLNKTDLVRPKSGLLPLMRTAVEEWGCREAVPVSALTGDNVDDLLATLGRMVPEVEAPLFPPDVLTDQADIASGSAHAGIANSLKTWQAALDFLMR